MEGVQATMKQEI